VLWQYDVFVKVGDYWYWRTNPEEFPNGALAASPEGAIEESDVATEGNDVRVIRRTTNMIKFTDGKRDE
jgi:hypothetical protein